MYKLLITILIVLNITAVTFGQSDKIESIRKHTYYKSSGIRLLLNEQYSEFANLYQVVLHIYIKKEDYKRIAGKEFVDKKDYNSPIDNKIINFALRKLNENTPYEPIEEGLLIWNQLFKMSDEWRNKNMDGYRNSYIPNNAEYIYIQYNLGRDTYIKHNNKLLMFEDVIEY